MVLPFCIQKDKNKIQEKEHGGGRSTQQIRKFEIEEVIADKEEEEEKERQKESRRQRIRKEDKKYKE